MTRDLSEREKQPRRHSGGAFLEEGGSSDQASPEHVRLQEAVGLA